MPVFNLSVEFNPEYFAAGVLVHNCDASAGAFNKLCGGGGFGAADLPDPAAGGPTELDRLAAAGAFR